MAFPVFNLAMGIIAGYYYGIKIKYQEIHFDQSEILIKKVPFFTALVMLIICITTSLIALSEKTIGLELQGMLKLNFEVTRGMIMTLILIGGSSLIIIQYFLTRITIIVTKKRSKS
jgi:hypothetical protein